MRVFIFLGKVKDLRRYLNEWKGLEKNQWLYK